MVQPEEEVPAFLQVQDQLAEMDVVEDELGLRLVDVVGDELRLYQELHILPLDPARLRALVFKHKLVQATQLGLNGAHELSH